MGQTVHSENVANVREKGRGENERLKCAVGQNDEKMVTEIHREIAYAAHKAESYNR